MPVLTSDMIGILAVSAGLSLPELAVLDGSSVYVSNGADLALLAVTSYTNTATINDQYRTLEAVGVGSVLDLPPCAGRSPTDKPTTTNLTIDAVGGSTSQPERHHPDRRSQRGGPAPAWDQRRRQRTGTIGGTVAPPPPHLSALTSFVDNDAGAVSGDLKDSTLTANDGGDVLAGKLAALHGRRRHLRQHRDAPPLPAAPTSATIAFSRSPPRVWAACRPWPTSTAPASS